MAKRLGHVLVIAGWLIGVAILWSGIAMTKESDVPRWFVVAIAAVPVLIGHACLYVLAGR